MGNKVNIFADVPSFLNLLANSEFAKGRDLKSLIRQRAEVFLIIDQEELDRRWEDAEDTLRKLCDAYDIPCPRALPKLSAIFKSPDLCFRLDPFGLWMINTSEQDIHRFRKYFGVWMVNPSSIVDDVFYLHHKRGYDRGDIIEGSTNNGWANYIEELSTQGKQLPPINAVVINDRYLLLTTNKNIPPEQYASYGLKNLRLLFDAILPYDLKIPFQLTIYCDHPQLDIATTDKITKIFKDDMCAMRPSYPIQIEFVYDHARHQRTFHSNYFLFNVDRAYNAFDCRNYKKLVGENAFDLESYHNDPYCTGDTNYITARHEISKIKEQCDNVVANPDLSNPDKGLIKRSDLPDPQKIQNRLFY